MSRIIVTCRSVLAISQSLVCLTAAVPPYQMHRCRETKVSGVSKRYEADVSGYLLPLADNYSYVTASARQCKFIRFSLLLYSKQERSLFTAALEQTSNVPTARDVGRLSGRIRRRACGLLYPGGRSAIASPVAFPACVSTRVPRRRRPGHSPPIVQRRPTGGGGRRRFPSPSSWGRWPFASPVALPCTRPGHFVTFWARHRRLCRLSAGCDGVPTPAQERCRVPASDCPPPFRAPAGDPTPITPVKLRTQAKSSLNQDPRIATLDPGLRFPGN